MESQSLGLCHLSCSRVLSAGIFSTVSGAGYGAGETYPKHWLSSASAWRESSSSARTGTWDKTSSLNIWNTMPVAEKLLFVVCLRSSGIFRVHHKFWDGTYKRWSKLYKTSAENSFHCLRNMCFPASLRLVKPGRSRCSLLLLKSSQAKSEYLILTEISPRGNNSWEVKLDQSSSGSLQTLQSSWNAQNFAITGGLWQI